MDYGDLYTAPGDIIRNIIEEIFPKESRVTSGIAETDIIELSETSHREGLKDFRALVDRNRDITSPYDFIRKKYLMLKAVLYYRVANAIYHYENLEEKFRVNKARMIAEKAKSETQVYISPTAKIGSKFVIEYGVATVIGEKVTIGNNCYIQHGVTLGSRDLEPSSGEHPTIGNNVQIGSFARVFGRIKIGDDVCLSPWSIVTENIPSGLRVLVINQLQLVKNPTTDISNKIIIYGIVPEKCKENTVIIYGKNMRDLDICLVDEEMKTVHGIKFLKGGENSDYLEISFSLEEDCNVQNLLKNIEGISLKMTNVTNNICIMRSICFKEVLLNCLMS